jgi:hypothetical protein
MMKQRCEACTNVYDPVQVRMYQMITAFKLMYPTSQGLHLRRAEQRFLCKPCLDAMERSGETWTQPSLFEAGS